jgi:D-arabinose 1-dehydrogenase-like Zn-dependent alcohol dehydrogenase
MKALQLTKWAHDAELRDVPQPDPRPGEVLVRIAAAGACHSDLHLMADFVEGMVPYELPFTIGHENAGWVEAVGEAVHGVEVGEPVAIYGPWGCGRCHSCLTGAENYCERQATLDGSGGGLGFDGGMASHMIVPAVRFFSPAYEVSVANMYWGTLIELVEVLALARSGLIRPEVQRFALDDALRAYAELGDGKVSGRAVILPNG